MHLGQFVGDSVGDVGAGGGAGVGAQDDAFGEGDGHAGGKGGVRGGWRGERVMGSYIDVPRLERERLVEGALGFRDRNADFTSPVFRWFMSICMPSTQSCQL